MYRSFCLLLFAAGVYAQSPTINEVPSREFGQLKLQTSGTISGSPNLVEGRELYAPENIAFDTTTNPPIMYVADTGNNRVLAWTNPAARGNGDKADKVIGQRDLLSTLPLGPGTVLSAGLRTPTAVAVDSSGNLYVLDAGNNRILRFPKPFQQTGDLLITDLVIGQRTVSAGNIANQNLPQPSEKTLAVQRSGTVYTSAMAFDPQGNLWVTDPLNNRVLRFPVAMLAANTLEPAADIVLGQTSMTTSTVASDPSGQSYWRNKQVLQTPSGIAFDANGRLYVSDQRSRVLCYFGALGTGVPATRVLGIPPDPAAGDRYSFPNQYNVGSFNAQNQATAPPEGVFLSGNEIYVVDTGDHRIMRFGAPETWAAETATVPSPPAIGVLGQPGFTAGQNQGGAKQPNGTAFSQPFGGAFLGTELWVVDTGNNRILAMPASGQGYGPARLVLGQLGFGYGSPNLLEGRELWLNGGTVAGGGVVVDKKSNPPHLYVADTLNNRILGFRDARTVGTDERTELAEKADIVIGQPDLYSSIVNYPSADTQIPSDTGLNLPVGIAVDGDGNLIVADFGNGRVLRFPSPFDQPAGSTQHANLVLGQSSFTTPPLRDAGISNMSAPYGLAVLENGSYVVSDAVHNRVLYFRRPVGGDFQNYQNATTVLGQPDFISSSSGNGTAQMKAPRHIAVDTSDRLYVADTGNNRLLVFTTVNSIASGAPSAFQLTGLNAPYAVTVSPNTYEIWVTNTNSNVVNRYPEFQQLQFNPSVQPAQISSPLPLAVTLDSFDNVVVADGGNRVTFYYAKLAYRHGSSYNQRPLAPGQLALIGRLGKSFSFTQADASGQNPWPTTLGDYNLTINGLSAPMFRIDPDVIQFQVPMGAPSSGNVPMVLSRPSTGEIVAATTLQMGPSNPGFYTLNAAGFGQIAAFNEDGTVNGPANPVGRGKVISFCLTGQGKVDGAPPDGTPPTQAAPTAVKPVVQMAAFAPSGLADPADILYSGLGCGFAGGWQINFRVAETIPPGNNNIVAVSLNDVISNQGPSGTIQVYFAVK